jgi:uncharacterized protein (TIGR02996 family)
MSHQEEALVQAVIGAPDDDGLRLMYADWLAEHGQPERADFIRVQVGLALLRRGDPRRPELEARERDLLAEHGGGWVDQLLGPSDGMVTGWGHSRGLVESLTVDARWLLGRGEAVFARAPVRHLMVVGARGLIRELAGLSLLARLRTLNLDGSGLGDEGVACLVSSPHLGGLETFGLGDNGIGDAGAQRLAASPNLPRLATLTLSANRIGDAGAVALADAGGFPRLRRVNLWHNPIGPRGRRALWDRFGQDVLVSEA